LTKKPCIPAGKKPASTLINIEFVFLRKIEKAVFQEAKKEFEYKIWQQEVKKCAILGICGLN